MERVRFMHIPKTAGTAISSVLVREYGLGRYFGLSGDMASCVRRFNALPENQRLATRLFLGHAPLVAGLPEADDARIITFLREPVKRTISFCQHVSEGKSPYLVDQFPPETFDLDEFLASGNKELGNLQTKFLLGDASQGAPPAIPEGAPVDEVRDMALENLLKRVHCFGLQDHFDESLMMFASALGWKRMPLYTYSNRKNPAKLITIEDRHRERIAELNAIDIQVYAAAKETFMNRVNSETFDTRRLARFRMTQRLLSTPMRLTVSVVRAIRRRRKQPSATPVAPSYMG